MSGHSHWARIKHKKGVTDARRGRLWSKLARDVIVAARSGGGDAEMNPRLRLAIDKAKGANMPKDTIENAIKKGTGELAGAASFEEILYEGYGPGGVAVMCKVLTDNRNRTAAEIKKIFERGGGNLGATNCVAWMFAQRGVISVDASVCDEDTLMEIALEAGADDVQPDADQFEITCDPSQFGAVLEALKQREIAVASSDLSMVPSTTITLDGETGRKVLRLIEALDDQDDAQSVVSNFEIPDEVMAELAE
jgi:YebC/PmpR family DNA-binding regulatory protein